MNEGMFNDIPAQKLHWLGVLKQRYFHEMIDEKYCF